MRAAVCSMLTISAIAFALPAVASADPPANDDRVNARSVTIPQRVNGTTVEATREDNESYSECATGKGSSWYRFRGDGKRVALSIEAEGDLDAAVDVFVVRRSQLEAVTCDVTNSRGIGILGFTARSGLDYLVRVSERSESVSGAFTLSFMRAADPARPPGRRLAKRGVSSSVNLASNPSDAWAVTMRAGRTYRINLSADWDGDGPCLRGGLYARGNSPDDGSAVKRLSCTSGYTLFTPGRGEGGRYSIFVESSSRSLASQRYHLQVGLAQRDDTAPGLFWAGLQKRGSLNARRLDAQDLYNWDLDRTANVNVRVAANADFEVRLFSIGGKRLGCTCNGGINRRLKPGTYYAQVYGSSQARGRYTLKRTVRTLTSTRTTFNGSKYSLVGAGSSVRLAATVSPAGNGKLTVTLERKDPVFGWQFVRTYTGSGSGGGLSTGFTPPGVGEYRAKAEFKGSSTANPSKSGYARLSVRR